MSNWYVMGKRGEQGPYTPTELRQRIEAGQIRESDSVRSEGQEAWLPARVCEELLNDQPASILPKPLTQRGMLIVFSGLCLVSALLFGMVLGQPGDKLPSPQEADAEQQLDAEPLVQIVEQQPLPAAEQINVAVKQASLAPAPQEHPFDPLPRPAVEPLVVVDAPIKVEARKVPVDVAEEVIVPVAPQAPSVSAVAYSGRPFGIAELQILFAENNRPRILPDQPVFVVAADGRVFYPAIEVEYADTKLHVASKLTGRFLFQGDQSLQLSFAVAGRQVGEETRVEPQDLDGERTQLTKAWWDSYRTNVDDTPPEQRWIRHYLAESLARRLNLPAPKRILKSSSPENAIEKYFETAVGLLLGFDSVELALQPESDTHLLDRREPRNLPLPNPLRIASVPVPNTSNLNVVIEPIARQVPAECFYVRTRSLKNYLWLRKLLLDWGGSLRQVVTLNTMEDLIRARIERQLCVDTNLALKAGLDDHIRDFALIGCDTLFQDGSALGVVLETTDTSDAQDILEVHRAAAKKQYPNAKETTETINGQTIRGLTTPDNRLRSFLVVKGRYLLLTNSKYLARRFLEASRDRNLGDLKEFRYARSKMQIDGDEATFIYLSDPFFRNVVSPHYRIEMQRRAQAMADIERARVAYATALSEGSPARTVGELIAAGYLSDDFETRPDGSRATLSGGYAVDSLRGAATKFVPVPDITVNRVTRSEAASYVKFSQGYRRQWRLMDPVSLSISRRPLSGGRGQIDLDICITPYAQEQYARMSQYLAPSNGSHILAHENDLVGVGGTLKSQGTTRNLYAALRDQAVEFTLANGEVVPQNLSYSNLGRSRFYLAMNPQSTNALQDVGQLLGMSSPAPSQPSPRPTVAPNANVAQAGPFGLITGMMFAATQYALPIMRATAVSSQIETRGNWLVLAPKSDFRNEILESLREERRLSLPMVTFHMQDITQADVYPYIRAYTYLQRRKASAGNAELLNMISRQVDVPGHSALLVAEYLCDTHLNCPLGGKYKQETAGHGPNYWSGTTWQASSAYEEDNVPDQYQFQFVNWLRQVQGEFNLHRTTLEAHVELQIQDRGK